MSYEKLGEGSFGCVHKPSLTCSDKKISYKNKVSKIMLSRHAMSELKEYAIIHKIDKHKDFYLGVPTRCKVKKTPKAVSAVKKCKHIVKRYGSKTIKKSFNKFNILVMSDGGIDIDYLAKTITQLNKTDENIETVKKIFIEFGRIFRGISTFQKHDIAHHDVKPQNIVYNMNTNRMNFIDFGHMRNMNSEKQQAMKSYSSIYSEPFWNYPLEIQFLNKDYFSFFSSMTTNEKEKWFLSLQEDIRKHNETAFTKAYHGFMGDYLYGKSENDRLIIEKKYMSDFHTFITNQLVKNAYEKILDKSIRTIDIYGLGLTLQYFLAHCSHLLKPYSIKAFESCFYKMITPDLAKRFTIDQAYSEFERIIKSL